MNELYITGDCHRSELAKIRLCDYNRIYSSTKSDIMVILGDWGAIWNGDVSDKLYLDFWERQPFSTFVILGNHENYDLIEKYPVVEEYGGLVRKPSPSVSIVVDSGIYNLNGRICACINGADSIDKALRKEGKSWWPHEAVSSSSISSLLKDLEKINYKINFLFTHTGGSKVVEKLKFTPTQSDLEIDRVINKLDEKKIRYQHYLGHYHIDEDIDDNITIMHEEILSLGFYGVITNG